MTSSDWPHSPEACAGRLDPSTFCLMFLALWLLALQRQGRKKTQLGPCLRGYCAAQPRSAYVWMSSSTATDTSRRSIPAQRVCWWTCPFDFCPFMIHD